MSVLATIGEEQNQEVICRFFEDDFYNRCFDEMTGEFNKTARKQLQPPC